MSQFEIMIITGNINKSEDTSNQPRRVHRIGKVQHQNKAFCDPETISLEDTSTDSIPKTDQRENYE